MTSATFPPPISVVVPTHNRSASLLRLLRALRDGSFPPAQFEVIVVADGCTDGSAEIARNEALPFPVRVLEQTPGRGAAAARNLGAAMATGGILVFLDDDIEPGPSLLADHHQTHAAAEGPAVVIGPPLPILPPKADLGTIAAWNWWEGQFGRMREPGHRFTYDEVFSGNLSVAAPLFQAVGGFDVEFSNCRDDSELGFRLIQRGAHVLFVPSAFGWHHELRDHPRLIRRKRAEGKADVRLARLHPELWRVLRISWPQMPPWNPLGLLRRLAMGAPPLADLLISGLTLALPVLERMHLRGTWRKVQAGVMYGWYWRGVRDAVGGRPGLEELARAYESAVAAPAPPLAVDLADGLEAAERQVDASPHAALTVRFGPIEIGEIPALPGAEPLRSAHLRHRLGNDLAEGLLAAMPTLAATGHFPLPGLRARKRSGESPPSESLPRISIITPAWNAAATIGETLASVTAQSHAGWELIVVDDGSSDETGAIVRRFADRDPRFRLIHGEHQGASAARGKGLEAARYDWIIFLDADDWLHPRALEHLLAVASRGDVDAVHGGWARVTVDGEVQETEHAPALADLFPLFADYCAFAIGCCAFRRELLPRIGGFDPALVTCEDWDLWQRMARSGARFVQVPELVVHYRMQLRSGATATDRLLPDGLRVIAQGHSPDPRVADARHPTGAPLEEVAGARLRFASWVAGLLLGRDESITPVLDVIRHDREPGLNPHDVASNLVQAIPLSLGLGPEGWDRLWPEVVERLGAFLEALEEQSGAWRLKRRVMRALEQSTLDHAEGERPFARGATWAVDVEVTTPICPISAPNAERVHCRVLAGGIRLGALVLPCIDGMVSSGVLTDAIASTFAWRVLGRFFDANRYQRLQLVRDVDGVAPWLDGAPLGQPVSDAVAVKPEQLHDHVGWVSLLQEVWGAPGESVEWFYRDLRLSEPETTGIDGQAPMIVEISDALPSLSCANGIAAVEVRAGGRAVAHLTAPGDNGVISPSRLRSVISAELGLELARIVVRETILGHPFAGDGIRPRLAALAHERLEAEPSEAAPEAVVPPPYRLSALGTARHFNRSGQRPASTPVSSATLPILMYHSIAPGGSEALARYRVSPENFEAQLRYLREAGFHGVSVYDWLTAVRRNRPLPGRSVMLTFDDGYRDFAEFGWPLLSQYEFGAMVFLVTDLVGSSNKWDETLSPEVPLLDWTQVAELAAQGVEFGSHSASHRPLTGLSAADATRELMGSRHSLEQRGHGAVATIAYPYGDTDTVLEHLAGACGYVAGFTARSARATFRDSTLALPRIEIRGDDSLEAFIAKVETES